MVVDEPAMWNLMPERQRARVLIVAKAMCRSRDVDDEEWEEGEGRPYCGDCDTPAGGSCVAFGLWGQMAIDVIEALDRAEGQSHG